MSMKVILQMNIKLPTTVEHGGSFITSRQGVSKNNLAMSLTDMILSFISIQFLAIQTEKNDILGA